MQFVALTSGFYGGIIKSGNNQTIIKKEHYYGNKRSYAA